MCELKALISTDEPSDPAPLCSESKTDTCSMQVGWFFSPHLQAYNLFEFVFFH